MGDSRQLGGDRRRRMVGSGGFICWTAVEGVDKRGFEKLEFIISDFSKRPQRHK